MKNLLIKLKKWLWCSWAHKRFRCYPNNPDYWHCKWCHPCGEGFDSMIKQLFRRPVVSRKQMKKMDPPLPPEKEE